MPPISLIDNPKDLLVFINDNLKPNQDRKEFNGEVFTPLYSIEELLDNLNKHYLLRNGRSVFTEKGKLK